MHRVTVLARKNKKQKNKGVKPNIRRKFNISDVDVVNFSNIEANKGGRFFCLLTKPLKNLIKT